MKKKGLFLVVHKVRSAHNVGSFFRTADALGVEKIYLCGYTPTPLGDEEIRLQQDSGGRGRIAKTALGAEKSVPWEHHAQTWRLLKQLQKEGVRVVALEQSSRSQNLRSYTPEFPMALVVGNEIKGLTKSILMYCDDVVEIPMVGMKESLNVSVAAGIALYHLIESDRRGE